MIEREEEVRTLIEDFFGQIKHKIAHTSYVIDFYITTGNQVVIIELNPFHNGAGGGLFSWAKDRELFLNGPLEFRITKELKEDPRESLLPSWQRFIDSLFEEVVEEELQGPQQSQEGSPKWWWCFLY